MALVWFGRIQQERVGNNEAWSKAEGSKLEEMANNAEMRSISRQKDERGLASISVDAPYSKTLILSISGRGDDRVA